MMEGIAKENKSSEPGLEVAIRSIFISLVSLVRPGKEIVMAKNQSAMG